jgi:predicted ferric reductase
MTRLKATFVGTFVFLTAMWLLSLSPGAFADFWSTRSTLIYYTGILAIGFMSAGVMLAARPVQVEGALGGLDKFYRLHKWLGIAAALLAVVHWLLEIVPRWMVRQGWLERPERGGGQGQGQGATGFQPFPDLREIAADLGEWSLYVLLVLIALALRAARSAPRHDHIVL